jgi:phenylalanyl-tRNA synthetase beta chain
MRPISAVVDVTNYVMHELGQPMHAYDADAVPGGQIVVRRAHDGERLETIDHVERRLDERMLVIADHEKAIGIAGIMGGASTEVTETTTTVILESAIFHGPTIRNTARRLGLRSEASMRHEKGIAPDLPRLAADRAARLIAEITGAVVGRGIVDNDPDAAPLRVVPVRLGRMSRLLGMDLDADRVTALLAPLGFEVAGAADDALEVMVPAHRLDVTGAADVAEEVARAHGYGDIEGRLPAASLPPYRPDPSEARHRVRRILAGLGLDEVIGHALIGADDLAAARRDPTDPTLIRIANPLSPEHAILRPSMAPSMLLGLAENARRRRPDAWLFEIGKVYWYHPGGPATPAERRADSAGTGRYEAWELGIALSGSPTPPSPGGPAAAADVATIKGVIEALHNALGAPRPAYRADDDAAHRHRHPGRKALVLDPSGRPYGSLGELHPDVVEDWNLVGRPVDAAIDLSRLLDLVPDRVRARPIPAAQPIDRDLAVVVDASTPVGELLRVARTAAGDLVDEVRLFDVYRGPQVGEGRVSYALAFRFAPADDGDEKAVEKALNKVRGSLRHHLGAEIR